MKWEAVLAMVGLFALGLWLVIGPGEHLGLPAAREGAELHEVRIGDTRGALEVLRGGDGSRGDGGDAGAASFRLLWRTGEAGPVMDEAGAIATIGELPVREALNASPNPVFRVLNITSAAGLLWVTLGLAGQVAFFGRMAVQWLVSEREKRSVVPPMFWYLSLVGGVLLFAYFVWRQDIVGVLGQTTGVVIYARNVRLLYKERARAARRAARQGEPGGATAVEALDTEPVAMPGDGE